MEQAVITADQMKTTTEDALIHAILGLFLLGCLIVLALDGNAQERRRPSVPIPAPSPGDYITIPVDIKGVALTVEHLLIVATWQPPSPQTNALNTPSQRICKRTVAPYTPDCVEWYEPGVMLTGSMMPPGDHITTEMRYTNACAFSCRPCAAYSAYMDIDLPQYTSNGAAAFFSEPAEVREMVIAVRSADSGQLLYQYPARVKFSWEDFHPGELTRRYFELHPEELVRCRAAR